MLTVLEAAAPDNLAAGQVPSPGPGHIIWLASYHKSGNTWLRLLFDAYGTKHSRAVDINAMHGNIAASRPMLDELLGVDTADFTVDELRELLPLAYQTWSAQPGGPHVLKNHEACARTRAGALVFPLEATRAVIHIVRDPRDVAVSAMHHWGLGLDETIERLNNPGQFVAHDKVSPQVPQWLSDWSGHARTWLESGLPGVVLRYEDMLADAAGSFRRVLRVCGLAVDEGRLKHAVDACRIERLREQERSHGFKERLSVSTAPFFREGRSGGWRDVLSAEQAERIHQHHGRVMSRFGYD